MRGTISVQIGVYVQRGSDKKPIFSTPTRHMNELLSIFGVFPVVPSKHLALPDKSDADDEPTFTYLLQTPL